LLSKTPSHILYPQPHFIVFRDNPKVINWEELMFDVECLNKFIEENTFEPINFEKWRGKGYN